MAVKQLSVLGNQHGLDKYTPEAPARYIKLCKEGGTTPEFCLDEDICRKTLENWCETYPEMKLAKIMGKYHAEAWYLRLARKHITITTEKDGPKTTFNTELYKFLTAGRFAHTSDKALVTRLELVEKMLFELSARGLDAYTEEAQLEMNEGRRPRGRPKTVRAEVQKDDNCKTE